MKKRNTTIFAFLLLAAVGMGVGYAAFTQDFLVDGDIIVNTSQAEKEFKEEIIFTAHSASTVKADTTLGTVAETTSLSNNDHTATLTINNLQAKGDICTASFTVTNKSDLPAVIDAYAAPVSPDASLFEITVQDTLKDDATLAAKGGSITFTVTIEMLKDPIKSESYAFTVGFNAVLG